MLTVDVHLGALDEGDIESVLGHSSGEVHWVNLCMKNGNDVTIFVPTHTDAQDLAALLRRIIGRS
jgi:hypothetical protein